MSDTVDLAAPTACPRCGKPVLVRRHSGNNAVTIVLDGEPVRGGTYMVTATTASVLGGKGGGRYRLHSCPPVARGIA